MVFTMPLAQQVALFSNFPVTIGIFTSSIVIIVNASTPFPETVFFTTEDCNDANPRCDST